MWILDFLRRKKPSDEAEAKRIINELKTLKAIGINTAKAAGKAVAVPFGIAESKTLGRVGIRTPVSFVEKPEAAKEIYNIAERVAAKGKRERKLLGEILIDVKNEIKDQFRKKQFREEWFRDTEKTAGDLFSSPQVMSLITQGIKSATEQVGYYEQQLGGQYAGQAVRRWEQFGSAASTVAQKTPGVGTMLFGKVPDQPAKRTKEMDPRVRSAINKARLELQKKSKAAWGEFKAQTSKLEKEAEPLIEELRKLGDAYKKLEQDIDAELTQKEAPGGGIAGGLDA